MPTLHWVSGEPLGPTGGHSDPTNGMQPDIDNDEWHGQVAIDSAVRAGVDSIEYGSYADTENYALMKQHGTYLVPTVLVAQRLAELARAHPERMATPDMAAKILPIAPPMLSNLAGAYKAGVKIAYGTDTTGTMLRFGENAEELPVMVRAGMTPIGGGSVSVGLTPTAVSADPLADISSLEHVSFVMKGGVVYEMNGAKIADATPFPLN